jgi:lysophospholipase L1-like esterase
MILIVIFRSWAVLIYNEKLLPNAETKRHMSKCNATFVLFYIFCAGIFVALALEGLVRLFEIAPPLVTQYGDYVSDPYLPYKPRPLSKLSGRSAEFDFEYIHNSLGFRDVEHSLEKPEGTFRILGLGDSFTYGVGVAFEETYLYKLEEMLNNREGEHPTVEIIKAGIPRFFPEAERLLLEYYGLDFKPDLILIGFLPNDIIDTSLGIDAVRMSESGYLVKTGEIGEIASWLYVHSQVFRIIFRQYISLTQGKSSSTPDQLSEIDRLKVERKIATEYTRIIELANQIDAKTVLIHIPQQGPWDDYAHGVASKLAEWSSSHNLIFIDVLPAMEKVSQNQVLYWQEDGHSNGAGHKVIAETIFSALVERNLVP